MDYSVSPPRTVCPKCKMKNPPPNNPQVEEKFEKSTHTLEHGESLTSHFSKPCKCHKSPKPDTSQGGKKCTHPKEWHGECCDAPKHVPKPDSRREVAVGIDMGSGDSKSVVSLAEKDEEGTIHVIACENVSNELAWFIDNLQAQNAELVSKVRVAEEALDCAKVNQECREGCNCEVCQAIEFILRSPSSI